MSLKQTLKVNAISVVGLFGIYNHLITLKHDERVTILHGPNGVGKSVVLRLLSAFFSGKYGEFAFVVFNRFIIDLSDGSRITIFGQDNSSIKSITNISISALIDGTEVSYSLPAISNVDKIAAQVERESAYITRAGDNIWRDYRYGHALSSEDLIHRYGSANDLAAALVVDLSVEPDQIKKIRSKIDVQIIETQRLLRAPQESGPRVEKPTLVATVRNYSADLIRQINRTLTKYGVESQSLDQTFPTRLISTPEESSFTTEELKEGLAELDKRYSSLNALGLVDKVSYPATPSQIDALTDVKRFVMTLYIKDTLKRLKGLEEIEIRIRLLLEYINGKFRNKKITVNREQGLVVTDVRGRYVRLESLSSGEQHEIVLWYDLLFKANEHSLILIDEPELSLHVTWQKRFLPELLSIAKTVGFDAILATHSPLIVGDRLDLTVALDAEASE